ncbi:MAG: glycosyltransferase [Candidatus Nanopelagicaceae bacterium]|nr:glycosyltransferase [Candidatus Nanopelagicaceae bacterium]
MNVGGPAVQVSGLMRGLDPLEFDHRLVTGFCAEDESDYLETVATDVHATRIKGLGRSISPKADLLAFLHVIHEIRSFQPHIIHTHTAKAGVIGRLASLLSGRNSVRVHTYHGHLLHGYFGKGKTFLVIVIEKFLGLSTTRLLAVGKKVMDDLLEAGIGTEKKFAVMPPGLKLGTLPPRNDACTELDLDPSKTYCAFIGRITKIKRPDRFLDVVSEIHNQQVPVHFIVAGAGDLLEYCKERVSNENLPVTFLGWREDIETVLAASDMVLLTSDNEGTPLSLIQAGMAKVPVVSTNVGSVSEIVVDQETGILTDLTARSLANALKELVEDGDLREDMGLAAYDYTMQRYSVERLVSDHQNLYVELLSRNS